MKKILLFIIFNLLASIPCFAETKIALLLPLSGAYASLGLDSRQGAEIAIEETGNLSQAEILFLDSKTEPSFAITEFNRAIDLNRIAAAYVLRGPIGMAVNPISKSKKLPLLAGIANKQLTIENPYAFQLWPNSESEGSFLAESFKRLNSKRVAILTAEDDYTMAVSNAALHHCKKEGLEIVLDQQFTPSEADFRSIALKIKKLNVDSIFVNVAISQLAPLIKQMRQMDIQSNIVSNFWLNKKEVVNSLGEYAKGLYFIEQATEYPALNSKLQRYPASASGATVSGYVAMYMINTALKMLDGAEAGPENLFQALLKVKSIETANGTFIVTDRKVQFPLELKQLKGL